ncbi:FACT complex subunit SPT16-like [Oscarella lobularis]|uniref:FACT complex subunit SPT16-like n=1 Tax=Oscarella lobularis TaxID=121494 RepID=UPI0033134D60
MAVKLDRDVFFRRAEIMYKLWKEKANDVFQGADAIVWSVGQDEDITYAKSTALQTWLFGYELPDTICVLTKTGLLVLTSKKKVEFLNPLKDGGDIEVELILKSKEDNVDQFGKLIASMKQSGNGKTIGMFLKEKTRSTFVDRWGARLDKESFEKVEIGPAMALVMAPKDEAELAVIKRAAQLSSDVFSKFYKTKLVEVVDQEKRLKHSQLADAIERALSDDKKWTAGMNMEQLEVCYPPIVQSGGKFQLKFSAVSDENRLHFGVIVCSFGARYKSYCSNIVRTMLVEPSEEQQNIYVFLVELEEYLLEKLVPGAKLAGIYEAVLDRIKTKRPELETHLISTIGFAMGIEFREGSLMINAKSKATAQAGMVFNVHVGLSNLKKPGAVDEADKAYALFIGDTVVVQEHGAATLLTPAKKMIKNIAIFLKDEDEDDNEDDYEPNGNDDLIRATDGRTRSKVLDSRTRTEAQSEGKRKEHQSKLAKQMQEEAKRRLAEVRGQVTQKKTRSNNTLAYKHSSMMPQEPDIQDLKIFVDRKYNTVVLPIAGIPTPFHISAIKNISKSEEGDYSYLRINFFCPGSTFGRVDGQAFTNPDATYVKEVTYRGSCGSTGHLSTPATNLSTAFRLIKEIQKKWKTQEAERKEREGIVAQEDLQLTKKNAPRLKDLYIRPNITAGKAKSHGVLEAHVNGFRFTSYRGGTNVDILYNNIRFAFYQPCDHEMIVLLHFNLKNPILLGKKKQENIQFYTEVGEMVTDLGQSHSMHDRDDLYAEQAEREVRRKLNASFSNFKSKVEVLTRQEVEFDSPFRELGFSGVPGKSTVFVQPTTHCLVHLTEWPPFVIALDDIELVHFERVSFHLKNFDMVYIFKDYTRKVAYVLSVPMTSLDQVKDWLDSCDIKYTEGVQSLNWVKIMKTIAEDPEGFFENGGWTFLAPESSEEESEGGESDIYSPSEGGDDPDGTLSEEDYESGSESEEEDLEDFSGEDEELGSDESEGKDWDELEKEAKEADFRRGSTWEEEQQLADSRKRKRHDNRSNSKRKR